MFLLNAGHHNWISGTKYDSFYVLISHTNATVSNSSTMHYSDAQKLFVSTKIKFKKPKHKNPKANRTEPNKGRDLPDNCKQNRSLRILPTILRPAFFPQLSQGGRLLWIVTLPAEQQHCRRWLSLGFSQHKTLEMLGAAGRNVAFLFLHFTSFCPDTSTLLISCYHHVSQVSGSGTHSPQNFHCAGSVCLPWGATLYYFTHPKGTTPNQLSHSDLTLPFCNPDCHCQPCSLSVDLYSWGRAIPVLFNVQVHLFQALFIAPSSVPCLRPQNLPVIASDAHKSQDYPVLHWRHDNTRENRWEKNPNKIGSLTSHHTHSLPSSPRLQNS